MFPSVRRPKLNQTQGPVNRNSFLIRLGHRKLRDSSDGIVLEAARQGLADLDIRHLLEDVRDGVFHLGQLLVCRDVLVEDRLEHRDFTCRGLDLGGCIL